MTQLIRRRGMWRRYSTQWRWASVVVHPNMPTREGFVYPWRCNVQTEVTMTEIIIVWRVQLIAQSAQTLSAIAQSANTLLSIRR